MYRHHVRVLWTVAACVLMVSTAIMAGSEPTDLTKGGPGQKPDKSVGVKPRWSPPVDADFLPSALRSAAAGLDVSGTSTKDADKGVRTSFDHAVEQRGRQPHGGHPLAGNELLQLGKVDRPWWSHDQSATM